MYDLAHIFLIPSFFLGGIVESEWSFLSRGKSVLFKQNGTETRVKSANAFVLENFAKATNQAICEARSRDKPDASCFEGTKGYRGKELCATGRNRVDCCTMLTGFFETEEIDGLFLEELVAAEFESALHEISGKCWAESCSESAGTFVLDDLTETANHAAIVGCRVELDSSLDSRWCY